MNWRHQRVFNKGIINTEAIGIGKGIDGSGRNGQNVRMHSGSVRQRGGRAVLVDFSHIAGGITIVRLWESNLEGQDGGGNWVWWNAYVFSSGTTLYYYDQSDATTVIITSALSNPNIWCVNIFDNQFVSNGEDALHIHAGGVTTWMPVGIIPPTLKPGSALAGGLLNNIKRYKYTYTRPTTVAGQPYMIESNPSPEETVDFGVGPGQSVTITMVPSGEAHARNYRLYATPSYPAGSPESTFYLISDQIIAGGNTYVDNLLTPTITEEDTLDRGVPPVCAQMMWHDNRLYLIGNPANKNIVYYSEIGRPFYFPDENWDEIARDDGDELTGLAALGATRYLFKERSIHSWTGDPTLVTPIRAVQASQTQNMSSIGIGCRDPLSIAQTLDFVVFRADNRHIYMLTRQELIKLSETAETDVEALAWDSTGAIYDDYYILNAGGTTLVWHLPTRTYQGKDTGITTNKFLVDHTGSLVYGNADEILQLYVGTQDEDADFTKIYRGKFYRVAEDEEEATFRRIRATTSERDCDFTIRTYTETGLQNTGVNALADRHYSLPRGVRGQYISAEIEWTGTAIIESIGTGFLKRGRRH